MLVLASIILAAQRIYPKPAYPNTSKMTRRDEIYQHSETENGQFRFDRRVAAVFEDMIERSVPGYELTLQLLGSIAARTVHSGGRCYDLGCALGASSLAILRGLGDTPCEIIAVDNAAEMINLAHQRMLAAGVASRVQLRCCDVREISIDSAALVVLNFTLQFLPIPERTKLIERIAGGLVPGGVLVLSEKLHFEDPEENSLLVELHHEFKRQQGYSDLEIARKRSALENVLVSETLETHRERLLAAGFREVSVWLQCFNFVSLLART